MMPQNRLSTTTLPSPFIGARALAVTDVTDYEDGGIALNDPSAGLMYQVWRARLIDDVVILDTPYNTESFTYANPIIILTGTDLTEISFTFDQNMRIALVYMQGGRAKLEWYDSSVESRVTTTLAEGISCPKIFLDDKRVMENSTSDIILAYVKDGNLYMRMQRDRFLIEYLLKTGVKWRLKKFGMGHNLRLQFLIRSF